MAFLIQRCGSLLRLFCVGCIWRCLLWSLWLLLALLLGLQFWLASAHELPLPAPVRRHLEKRLAQLDPQGRLRVHLDQVSLDPHGRVLIENASILTATTDEPLLTLRTLYLQLDPVMLMQGEGIVQRVECSGLSLYAPSMFSSSGQPEPWLRELTCELSPYGRTLQLDRCSGNVAGLTIEIRGSIDLRAWARTTPASTTTTDWLTIYLQRLRQAVRYAPQLTAIGNGHLRIDLTPHSQEGAIAHASLLVGRFRLDEPTPLEAKNLRIETQLSLRHPLAGNSHLVIYCAELTAPDYGSIQHLRVDGETSLANLQQAAGQIDLTADSATLRKVTVQVPQLKLAISPPSRLQVTLLTQVTDVPITASADLDWRQRSGRFAFATQLTNPLVAEGSRLSGVDLSKFLIFGHPTQVNGHGTLAPGGKLDLLQAWVTVDDLLAHKVRVGHATGWLELRGNQFTASGAHLTVGENEARGSYTMDFATRDYRFLLRGQLRPMDINGWFTGWWGRLWQHFDFSPIIPHADVDVQGRWTDTRLSNVFVGVESQSPTVRSVTFDYARTHLFIRPDYVHALDFLATHAGKQVNGWFSRMAAEAGWRSIDFAADSTIEPAYLAPMYGPEAVALVQPYRFDQPPHVQVTGHLDGPAAPAGPRQRAHVDIDSPTPLSVYGLPLGNLQLTVDYDTGEFLFSSIRGAFAGGEVSGKAQLSKRDNERILGLDASVKHVDLGRFVTELQSFAARQQGRPVPPARADRDWMKEVQLDLDMSAEGPWIDLLQFHGNGSALLSGSNLAKVRMLGRLSEVLPFTSLRFTTALAGFKLKGPIIEFPEVRLIGNNSSIYARGNYLLERQALDFNAKVYPFGESEDGLRGTLGFFLVPISLALEVKLGGSLDDPSWVFLHGLSNLLRTDAGESATGKTTPTTNQPRATHH